jgi:hypothetical protein
VEEDAVAEGGEPLGEEEEEEEGEEGEKGREERRLLVA